MSKYTRLIFFIALVYSISLLMLFGYGFYQLQGREIDLASTRHQIAEQAAKKSAYSNLEQVIKSTTADRTELQTFFITEKKTVDFISEIEANASAFGVKINTTQLSINPKTTNRPAQLYTAFKFSGSEAAVKRMITLFELIPYHKSIPELTLIKRTDDNIWEGSILIYITIAP